MADNAFHITAGLPPIDGSTTMPANAFYLTAGLPPPDLLVGLVAPTLTAPMNMATGVELRPTFTWS